MQRRSGSRVSNNVSETSTPVSMGSGFEKVSISWSSSEENAEPVSTAWKTTSLRL
jgi:hypothetical protein